MTKWTFSQNILAVLNFSFFFFLLSFSCCWEQVEVFTFTTPEKSKKRETKQNIQSQQKNAFSLNFCRKFRHLRKFSFDFLCDNEKKKCKLSLDRQMVKSELLLCAVPFTLKNFFAFVENSNEIQFDLKILKTEKEIFLVFQRSDVHISSLCDAQTHTVHSVFFFF